MKKVTLLFFSVFIILTSCNEANVYSKFYDDFASNRWEEKDSKQFEFAITDDAKTYDLILKFGHIYEYQFASVPMNIVITGPDGKEETITIDLQIKDAAGKDLADCSGDICDLEYKIKEKVSLAKGNYKIKISHTFNGPFLPNVLGVGLNVEISK